jgi:hypothetical protein
MRATVIDLSPVRAVFCLPPEKLKMRPQGGAIKFIFVEAN